MNSNLERALECNEFGRDLPILDIGDEVTLGEVWDGEGPTPEDSYAYQINDMDWINYEFDVIKESEDELETEIVITNIDIV